MSHTIQQLAELVHGEVVGNGDLVIHAARPVREAKPGEITFIEDERHAAALHTTHASAAVVKTAAEANGMTYIRVAEPLDAFVAIVRRLHGRAEPPPHGIDPLASIHPTAHVGAEASVHPFAVVGEGTVIGARCRIHSGAVVGRFCRLGDDVVLHPNAVLYDDTVLGDRVIIHASTVIGADGFGYRFQNGHHAKVPQLGNVEIGDDVEIGACTAVDRGTFQSTRIGAGTKIDNLVQVAHNCQIGRHNLIVSQVGIAGSVTTGDYVVIAGQAGVINNLTVGERTCIGAQTGITRDVPAGQRMLGTPARQEIHELRIHVCIDRLPEMARDVRRIKKHLGLGDPKPAPDT